MSYALEKQNLKSVYQKNVAPQLKTETFVLVMNIIFHCNALKSTLGSESISGKWKPFENYKKCFLFHLKKYLNFCSDLFSQVGKRLDEKPKLNFKI